MIKKQELKQKILDWFKEYDYDIDTEEKALTEINEWANIFWYSDMLWEWWDLLESLEVWFRIWELYISWDESNTFYYYEDNKWNKIFLWDFDTKVESFDKLVDMFIWFEEKILNEWNQFELSTRKHLTEIITDHVKSNGDDISFTFINNKWNIVVINKDSWNDDIHYDIYDSILKIQYFVNIDWWVIIFIFDEDVSYVDKEEQEMYLSDYQDYKKDTDAYIKSKVDYIMELTWDK